MSEQKLKPDWQARIVNMRKTIKALGDESCIPPEYMLEALDEIERLQSEARWIPVSDRLPEVNKRIMFFGGFEQTTHIGYYREPQWESENGGFWYGRNFGLITHWQPLPPPPTGEAK